MHRLTELYARFRADYDELNGLVRQLAAWAELVGQGLGLVNRAPVQEPAGGAWQAAGTGPHGDMVVDEEPQAALDLRGERIAGLLQAERAARLALLDGQAGRLAVLPAAPAAVGLVLTAGVGTRDPEAGAAGPGFAGCGYVAARWWPGAVRTSWACAACGHGRGFAGP